MLCSEADIVELNIERIDKNIISNLTGVTKWLLVFALGMAIVDFFVLNGQARS